MTGGCTIDRWEAKKLIVKAMTVAQVAGKDEQEQVKIAAMAILMRYPNMGGAEAIEWVERLGPR